MLNFKILILYDNKTWSWFTGLFTYTGLFQFSNSKICFPSAHDAQVDTSVHRMLQLLCVNIQMLLSTSYFSFCISCNIFFRVYFSPYLTVCTYLIYYIDKIVNCWFTFLSVWTKLNKFFQLHFGMFTFFPWHFFSQYSFFFEKFC